MFDIITSQNEINLTINNLWRFYIHHEYPRLNKELGRENHKFCKYLEIKDHKYSDIKYNFD